MTGFWVGLIAGSLGGLVGIGGGVIVVPLMTEVWGCRQQEAHGTSLVAVVLTSLSGSVIYYLHGSVDIAAAAILAGPALLTVRFGARYSCLLPEQDMRRHFGRFLLVVALLLILKPFLPGLAEGSSHLWVRWIVLALLGVLTGFISGMMGVGGGSFMAPMMVIFAGISQYTAQGISLLAMIPAATLGVWTYGKMGFIKMNLLPGLIVGVLVGVTVCGRIAHLVPERELRLLYAALLLYTALRYVRKEAGTPVCVIDGDHE